MERFAQRRERKAWVIRVAACSLLMLWGWSALPAQDMQAEPRSTIESFPGKASVAGRTSVAAGVKYTGPQPFDILHYMLDLSFAMTSGEMGGTVGITMVLKAPLDSLVLNEAELTLDTILVDGLAKSFSTDSASETFTIRLGALRDAGDTIHIAIAYRRGTATIRPGGRWGYYYFTPDSVSGSLPDTLGYTMSEPSDARFWMPCFDDPSEKATAEIRATVPSGFVAASNGKLLGTTTNSDGTITWHWREDHQIAPYLMCVTISKWTISTYPFVRGANDTIPVQYYLFKPDSAGAAGYLPTVAQMIGAFSKAYGPYPFDKYGMSAITPFRYGGMEHQSMTTLARGLQTHEGVVSHELAHQWWGDLVTCGTWPDIWLNESFATYSEAIWREFLGGFTALRNYMLGLQHFSRGSWQGAVYDPEGQGFNLLDDVVYSKGAWVLHTLRGVLGDSVFFGTLRAYRQKFAGGNAVTNDLRAVADSVSGTSLAWFFNEWIYGAGWPVYAFSSSWAADTVTLHIIQQQSTAWPTYTMPVRIRFYYGTSDTTIVVINSGRKQTLRIPLSFQPDSVKFDPDNWILKQLSVAQTGVADVPAVPVGCELGQNYPNPFNPLTGIKYTIGGSRGEGIGVRDVSIVVYDVLGRHVAELVNEKKQPGTYTVQFDGSGLASGVYFYRLVTGSYVQTRAMILMK
jgi:aminopeptidase N